MIMENYVVKIRHGYIPGGIIDWETEYIFENKDNAQKLYDALEKMYGDYNSTTSFSMYTTGNDTDDSRIEELLKQYS